MWEKKTTIELDQSPCGAVFLVFQRAGNHGQTRLPKHDF